MLTSDARATGAGRWATPDAWLAATTACVGAIVVLAPFVTVGLRIPLLIAALLAWSLAAASFVLYLLSVTIGAGRYAPVGDIDDPTVERIAGWLGLTCVLAAALAASSLFLVRVIADRPDLLWNVDWRFTLSHAQAIARTGGTGTALDYAGVPIQYHVGPAWLAGAWGRAFGGGVTDVLLGAVPLLATLGVVAGLTLLLRGRGLELRPALVAAGAALVMPAASLVPLVLARSPGLVFDEDTWTVGSSLMLNSYFALGVGTCALALLCLPRRGIGHLTLGAVGLAALVGLKPQYLVGLGLLAGLLGLARWSSSWPRTAALAQRIVVTGPWLWGVLALLILLPFILKMLMLPNTARTFLGLVVFAAVLLPAVKAAGARSDRGPALVITAAASLAVAVALLEVLPGVPSTFGQPAWAPGRTTWSAQEYLSVSTLLYVLVLAVAASVETGGEGARLAPTASLARSTLLAIALVASTLHLVIFPLRPALVEQGLRLGGFQIDAVRGHRDLAQALLPLRVVLIAACVAVLHQIAAVRAREWRLLLLSSVAALACLRFVSLVPPMIDPARGYEAVAETDMRRTLAAIPVEGSLIVSSDIADPAQDYARPANGSLLSAYWGHSYFLSELRYIHWTRPDAPERLDALRTFFGSHWTNWHDTWLAVHGITHVIVDRRCRPVWADDPDLPLAEIARHGDWTAFEVHGRAGVSATERAPAWTDLRPAFGRSECLLLRRLAH